jgi:hypothetical protein
MQGFSRWEGNVNLRFATYVKLRGKFKNLCHILEPLLSGDIRDAQRSRVDGTAKVLVQVFGDEVEVRLSEPPDELAHESDLRGIGVFEAERHLGEAMGRREDLGGLGGAPACHEPRIIYVVSHTFTGMFRPTRSQAIECSTYATWGYLDMLGKVGSLEQ